MTNATELRPSYRTLNEPTRLLGLSLGGWAGVITAAAVAYAFVGLSPLPWRLNFSAVVIGLGGPLLLLILREPGTIGPGGLLLGAFAWRLRSSELVPPDSARPVSNGAVRLDAPLELVDDVETPADLPWAVGR